MLTIHGTGSANGADDANAVEGQKGILANSTGNGDNSKTLVNFGTLIVYDVTINNSTASFSVWNSNNGESNMELHNCLIERGEPDIIAVVNSGTLLLDGCTIHGGGDLTHPVLLQNAGNATVKLINTKISNSGNGYSLYRESGNIETDAASDCPNAYGVE